MCHMLNIWCTNLSLSQGPFSPMNYESFKLWWILYFLLCSSWWSGPIFCLLLGVSSGCARPITGQVTSVTWPVIGWVKSELSPSKRQKSFPDCNLFGLSFHVQNSAAIALFELNLKCPWNGNCEGEFVSSSFTWVYSNAMDKTAHLIEMNMFDMQLAWVHDKLGLHAEFNVY